jgi:hypothetical protein
MRCLETRQIMVLYEKKICNEGIKMWSDKISLIPYTPNYVIAKQACINLVRGRKTFSIIPLFGIPHKNLHVTQNAECNVGLWE